jgi:hypothetical protein
MHMDHLIVCLHEDRYATFVHDQGKWDFHAAPGKRGGVLKTLIDQSIASLLESRRMVAPAGQAVPQIPIPQDFSTLPAFTFSTRSIEEIIAGGLVMDEAALATAHPTMSLTTLMPDGTKHGRWTAVLRDRGRPWSDPTTMRFAVQTIKEQIERGLDWEALKVPAEHHREAFLVRPSFSAHRLLPDVYKLPAVPAQQVAAEAKFQELRVARDPRLKRQRLQAQQQIEARLLDKNLPTEERAAIERAKKVRAFGEGWEGAKRAE